MGWGHHPISFLAIGCLLAVIFTQSIEAQYPYEPHAECQATDFRCRSGHCIPKDFRCNLVNDCPDGDDEETCQPAVCQPTDFRCYSGDCIPEQSVCNGISDCPDGDDEEHCQPTAECRPNDYRCRSGHCIPIDFKCNGLPECPDGDDEQNCRPIRVCQPTDFRCYSGDCVPEQSRCNGVRECRDGDDEDNCPTKPQCRPTDFACYNGDCVPEQSRCNGVRECLYGEDEDNCPPIRECQPNEFPCRSGHCIPIDYKCNGASECPDGDDELNCQCQYNEYRCHSGHCIPNDHRCNRVSECPDGDDEENCRCHDGQFKCQDGACVDGSARCNGRHDCPDGSDERDCPGVYVRCQSYQWPCTNGYQCINIEQRCDQRHDCSDFSDEIGCPAERPPPTADVQLKLMTYPPSQTIKESREVVFRCRDEGSQRAQVRWSRPSGRPLPSGFTDINGRLEIPNIRYEDSGDYVCSAVDYPAHTRGQSVTVHLTVEKYNPILDRPPSACGYHEATCMNGECIAKSQICDGIQHCSDSSDEHSCSQGMDCNPDQFLCKNTKCIDRVWRCDGENDCGDNTDEESCDPNPTGSPCRYDEFQCNSGQCIPKTFHCDRSNDCQDGSDEFGCIAPHVVVPPPPRVDLQVGSVLNITCRATGVPIPLIIWRLNWGHVPKKCQSTSVDGFGTLYCPDMQKVDSGAYSCEILNTIKRVFVTPDTIVSVIADEEDVCPAGFFNAMASRTDECINCFCFGVATQCKSADLFTYALPPPVISQNVVSVELDRSGYGDIRIGEYSGHNLITLRHGVQFRASNIPYTSELPYLALPAEYLGPQLKSYGGFLKYEVQVIGTGPINFAPDVIIIGNGYTLTYRAVNSIEFNIRNPMSIPLSAGSWYKSDGRRASREEIMMVLANVDKILIKLQYTEATEREVELIHITMDSAGVDDRGLGSASLVEQCQCPPEYIGDSCERCAPGYVRQKGGPWLGRCVPEPPPTCPEDSYGDPRRNIPCRKCPCPLTNPENNFARSCSLGADNDVICHCKRGYTGRRCEQCEEGYEGNPMIYGGDCRPKPTTYCDTIGTKSVLPDGSCECKDHVIGLYCDKCAAGSFLLSYIAPFGCIECFCMGFAKQCSSSSLYRDTIHSRFNGGRIEHGFSLVSDYVQAAASPFSIHHGGNELRFEGGSDGNIHYWSLPSQFLGNKITSYGGNLNYTIRYNALPGGLMSKNVAPDVVIKSNHGIDILHYRKDEVHPSGSQTYEIPILENEWQRSDGRVINRQHLLMALADVSAIYIKATYTTVTAEAAISHVSLDIGTKANIGTRRALEVEHCACPTGHIGLSCENCAPGYKRSDEEGIYLGICEPCECNGHSNECDAETGRCLSCRGNTAGDQCQECAPGFVGNATEGSPYGCRPESDSQRLCERCDFRGYSSCSANGQCICKANVDGYSCDHCREGTFNLDENNVRGCTECFCSGVTNSCSSARFSRDEIPFFVLYDELALTNHEGVVQFEGFQKNADINEASHRFNAYTSYFWRLPSQFLGNQLKSYGGKLQFEVKSEGYGEYVPDNDIILRGNGLTLVWSRPQNAENVELISTKLHDSEKWSRLERTGLQRATHSDFLTVLSNVEQILIRATLKSPTTYVSIANILLETANERQSGGTIASEVEVCRCPMGYDGLSCESCSTLHYRDQNGACTRCPCENSDSCSLSYNGEVECHCLPGYDGPRCNYNDREPQPQPTTSRPPEVTITVTVSSPLLQIIEIGESVRLDCSGQVIATQTPIKVEWLKYRGDLPRDSYQHDGILYLRDLQVHDSGIYICQARRGSETVEQNVTITIGDHERPSRPVVHIMPSYVDVEEFHSTRVFCEATGYPTPVVSWSRQNEPLSSEIIIEGNYLILNNLRKSDEGTYRCRAQNSVGSNDGLLQVYVKSSYTPSPLPPPNVLYIEPPTYTGRIGEEIRLTCNIRTTEQVDFKWFKDDTKIYSDHIYINNNLLIINNANAHDSGPYTCRATNPRTNDMYQSVAHITIESSHSGSQEPRIKQLPADHMVIQGHDLAIVCEATGSPYPTINWTKLHEPLDLNIQQVGNTLRIVNAQPSNRGVYICIAESAAGIDQISTVVDVDPRERPRIEVYPLEPQTVHVGESVMLSCRAVGGIPEPKLRWERRDRKPISPRVHEEYSGTISIKDLTIDDAGEYECHAENIVGSVSAVAVINVHQAPEVRIYPNEGEIEVTEGDELKLSCVATGYPKSTVTWDDEYQPTIGRADYDLMSTEAVLNFHSIRMNNEKLYTCTARNDAGEDRKYVSVRVKPRRGDVGVHESEWPTYTTYKPNQLPYYTTSRPSATSLQPYKVGVGDQATLGCQIEGAEARTVWDRIDGRPLPRGASIFGNNLIIENVGFDAAGQYQCSVIDHYGTRPLVTAEIIVIPIPRITFSPPMPMVVRSGENVAIFCNATGEQPIRVEWHAENHRPLPYTVRADGQYLRFNHITPADAGRYYCSAENIHGNTTKVAEVLVNRGTLIDRPQQSRVHEVIEGDSVALDCDIPHDRRQPGMRFNWRRSDRPNLPSNANIDQNRLILRNIRREDEGRYICDLVSSSGLITNNFVDVVIKPPASHDYPVIKLDPPRSYIKAGESTEVECYSSTDNHVDVVWERADGQSLPYNVKQIGNKLVIANAKDSDSGDYVCKCVTQQGQIYTSNYKLNIEELQHQKKPMNQLKVEHAEVGSTVILRCDNDRYPSVFKWSRQHGQFSPGQDLSSPELRLVDVQATHAGPYICTAIHNGQQMDSLTTLVVTGAIPYFPQTPNSYMIFPKLENAYMKFNFEITFKPERPNGLILFNGQKKGTGDYIALSINDRYPEFRFDFGNKPTVIRSEEPIELGEWHTVKVNRVRKEGFMIVDNQRPVAFPPATHFIGLDLIEPMYIGSVPKWEDLPNTTVAHHEGFVGCLSRLILKDEVIELNQDAKFKEGVKSCEPCADEPCQNDGVCLESQTETGYTCSCQEGFTGRNCAVQGSSCTPDICGVGRCENTEFGMECFCPLNKTGDKCQYIEHLDEGSLSFRDGSYAAYKTPRASKLNIKFNIRPDNLEDGVVMYAAESENANGDFVAVVIKDKHLELRLNTGARLKPLIIRSQHPLVSSKWVEVQISRKLGEGFFKVGNEPQQTGKAVGPARSMYLKTYLYIGGYDKRILLNKGVEVTRGFDGCISKLEESSQPINMIAEILDAANVQNCGDNNEISNIPDENIKEHLPLASGCSREPCENGGTCVSDGNDFICQCPLGYIGTYCEEYVRLDLTARFHGNSYLELDHAAFSNSTEQLSSFVAFLFSTTEPNGLLLWYGQEKGHAYIGQDYMALAIVDGILEFSFRLDGQEDTIRSPYARVDDGHRHVTIIKRTKNEAKFELDHLLNHGELRPTARDRMHLPGHLFIGGAPNLRNFTGNRFSHGFKGCVRVVEAQEGGPIHLGARAISAVNVDSCPKSKEEEDLDLGTEPPVV